MFNVVLINFDQIFFLLKWNFSFPGAKIRDKFSRSKPRLFDTSTYSLINHTGRQQDRKQGF